MQLLTIIGRCGGKVTETSSKNGETIRKFSLAVSPKKDVTVWYECVIWPHRYEQFKKMLPYLDKGSKVFVSGDLSAPYLYTGKDGGPRCRLSISVHSIQFFNLGKEEPSVHKQESFI